MICHNPECRTEFEPERDGQVYCQPKCRNRAQKLREKAKRHATLAARVTNMKHPCKKCGKPVGYKLVYCDDCKSTPKGAGIVPLSTPRITAARRREMEAIERVVAKSIAEGRQGGCDDNNRRLHGRLNGHKIG